MCSSTVGICWKAFILKLASSFCFNSLLQGKLFTSESQISSPGQKSFHVIRLIIEIRNAFPRCWRKGGWHWGTRQGHSKGRDVVKWSSWRIWTWLREESLSAAGGCRRGRVLYLETRVLDVMWSKNWVGSTQRTGLREIVWETPEHWGGSFQNVSKLVYFMESAMVPGTWFQ